MLANILNLERGGGKKGLGVKLCLKYSKKQFQGGKSNLIKKLYDNIC